MGFIIKNTNIFSYIIFFILISRKQNVRLQLYMYIF